MVNMMKSYLNDAAGIAAIEYAVIGSFMGLALIPLLPGVSNAIETRLTELAAFF